MFTKFFAMSRLLNSGSSNDLSAPSMYTGMSSFIALLICSNTGFITFNILLISAWIYSSSGLSIWAIGLPFSLLLNKYVNVSTWSCVISSSNFIIVSFISPFSVKIMAIKSLEPRSTNFTSSMFWDETLGAIPTEV